MPDPFGLLGQVIDQQLRIDSFVSDGDTSVVYRGQHLGGGPIALKCLKVKPDPDLMERLKNRFWETCGAVDALAQEEQAVCRVVASGMTTSPMTRRPVVYMAMEWLDGQSLAANFRERRIGGSGGRTWGEVYSLFTPVANALGRAHSRGIVHRDVQPTNLYLQQGPSGPMLRILDFGVAKILDDEGASDNTKSITKAPYYAAPEVFEPRFGKAGPWTDVYQLSLVIIEALRDQPARQGRTYADIAHEIIEHKRVPSPRNLGMSVTDPIEQVFVAALSLDPSKRPQSAYELWTRLRRALGLPSERPPPGQVSSPPTRRVAESSGTVNMPSPSQMPPEVRQYLQRPKLPTPTSQFDDERTVAVPPPDTLDNLPPSVTPAMGAPAFTPTMGSMGSAGTAPAYGPMSEPSALVIGESALISVESDVIDRTVAMPDAPPRVPSPAGGVPAAKSAFAGTMAMPGAPTHPAPPAPTAPSQPHVVIQTSTGQPPRIMSPQPMAAAAVPGPPRMMSPQPMAAVQPPMQAMQPGMQPMMQPGMQPMQPMQPGMQPMMQPGMQPMMQPPQGAIETQQVQLPQQQQSSRTLLWAVVVLLSLSLIGAAGAAAILMTAR